VRFLPPLMIEKKQVDEACDIFTRVVEELEQ